LKVILFGGTGMIGQGVLRECLLDTGVALVVTIGRTATAVQHPKLREIVHKDLWDYSSIEPQLRGFDACLFCLGVTSAGMSEEDYSRVTYGITHAAAETLCRLNPGLTFVFVSGAGADSTEGGRIMWARVKGKAENAVLKMPCHASFVFRPGVVLPMHGETSRTRAYRVMYAVMRPLLPLLKRIMPGQVVTTEQFGRAMLIVAREGSPTRVLESSDINAISHL
jgi:uncharacterized protein YbjT (DUF2867 family)